jgi:photosystem II stability/assembly factor-like uncharacterized protein
VTQVAAATVDGVFVVDLDDETVAPDPLGTVEPESVGVELPLVVAAAAAGSTVVAVVRRRPPLAVSHDAGSTWREAGGGLPEGRAVAIGDDPDLIVFAGRNRLYVSRDGGRFWARVDVELPEIEAIEIRGR